MDVATKAWLDQEDAHVRAIIRRHGWFIQYVGGDAGCTAPGCDCSDQDSLPFAYTVGLFGMDHPELLIFGVPQQTAGGVLNHLGDQIRGGRNLLPGELVTFEAWPHRVIPEEVPNPGQILFSANRFFPVGAGVRGAGDAAKAGYVRRLMRGKLGGSGVDA